MKKKLFFNIIYCGMLVYTIKPNVTQENNVGFTFGTAVNF